MKDPLTYTYDGLERELNLVEIHLKEAPKGDEAFCRDCINKHFQTIRGFALEGPGFTQDKNKQEKFLEIEKEIREMKGKDYKKYGVEFSQKIRQIRKDLSGCSKCEDPKKVSAIKKLTKDLNTKTTFNNYQLNLDKAKMPTYTELAFMNAGQFAAEGVRYLAETNATLVPYEKWVTIGGGVALQALGLFVRMPTALKNISLVAGSNLLAGGVIKMVRGAPTAIARVGAARAGVVAEGVGGYAGKAAAYAPTFGGPVFGGRVTASNIPTRYARAGILAGAQAFESPEHADLIRVD